MRQLILLLLNFVSCLYEDQIGKFDWRKELIGVPLFVAFDVSKGPTKYVSVYSERNVSFLKKVLFSRPGLRGTSSSSTPRKWISKIQDAEDVDVLWRSAQDLIS